jgi:hypothetical protein
MTRWTTPLVALLLASACTSGLDVKVDVMNPAYTRAAVTEVALLTDANELARGGHVRADRVLDVSMAQLQAFYTACIDRRLVDERAALAALPSGAQALDKSLLEQNITVLTALRNGPSSQERLAKLKADWRSQLYMADDAARQALATELPHFVGLSGWESPQARQGADRWSSPLSDAVKIGLAEREVAYDQHVAQVQAEIANSRNLCEHSGQKPSTTAQTTVAVAAMEKQAKDNVAAAKLTSITGGGVLLNGMTEAYFVTNASDAAWAPVYNRAVARGELGNMSVAIKMNDTADFSIKGMVFDGRSTAEMMKKLATQTVATIASAYGAPFSISSAADNSGRGTLSFDKNLLISAPDTTVATARANEEAYRSALFQIADSVAANFEGLISGNATAEAIAKATLDANKARWQSAAPPAGKGNNPGRARWALKTIASTTAWKSELPAHGTPEKCARNRTPLAS